MSVYEWDLGIDRFAPGLRRMPKITEEHVNLNPALRIGYIWRRRLKEHVLGIYV